ncbi:MAG: hypothetical protein P8R54_00570 [Myxococcota bacterium]|nr:hypothetical protein [Myxococcota bacterium]
MKRALITAALLSPVLAAGRDRATVAVLINGGHKAQSNYESHLVHLEEMADVLDARGVSAAAVFSSDGEDDGKDMAVRAPFEHPDRWLLEGTCLANRLPKTHLTDTPWDGPRQPASAEALSAWFSDPPLSAGDTLLLYTTDHGWRDKETGAAGLWLWGEKAEPDDLSGWLTGVPDGVTTVMVMSHCYSGAFAETVMDGALDGTTCGFFSAPKDRRAYGCYPEGRASKTMGHGFRFIDALADAASAAAAHERVLVTDRTPDVPQVTSDLYLHRIVSLDAAQDAARLPEHVDALLDGAVSDPLIAAMAAGVGLPVPGSMAEVAALRAQLEASEPLVSTRDSMWSARLQDLVTGNACGPGVDAGRLQADALTTLLRQHAEDAGAWSLMAQVATAQQEAADIRWRMEVREAVLMRIEGRLMALAGEAILTQRGRRPQRRVLKSLRRCEAAPLGAPGLDAVPLPAAWPSLEADLSSPVLSPSLLGLGLEDSTDEPGAMVVVRVIADRPAQAAGFQLGDVVLGPPDALFVLPGQARAWAAVQQVGVPVMLQVRRQGEHHTLTISPDPFPEPTE